MRAWWRARSKNAKRRVVLYGGLAGVVAFSLGWVGCMPGKSHKGPLPPFDDTERSVAATIKRDVEKLSTGIGERNMGNASTLAALDRAWAVIELAFFDAGLDPKRKPYKVDEHQVANIDATVKGKYRAEEIVVVGAHYDTAPGTPGADDNASGVAAMFALARVFADRPQARSVRFVAFTNEEPPHFWTPQMGSLVYAKDCKAKNENIVAMLSLETLGYYRDEPGTQKYPPIVSWFYPDRGDFVAFVGNLSSRGIVRDSVGAFRSSVKMPSEGAALPSFIEGVGWSDQWSFWEVGYPGVMVTDTAPFRNPNYHKPSDKPETLDYERLARVVTGLVSVVEKLAQ